MEFRISDKPFFYRNIEQELRCMCTRYIDGTLHTGNDKYSNYCKKAEIMFICKKKEWDNLQFAGVYVEKKDN